MIKEKENTREIYGLSDEQNEMLRTMLKSKNIIFRDTWIDVMKTERPSVSYLNWTFGDRLPGEMEFFEYILPIETARIMHRLLPPFLQLVGTKALMPKSYRYDSTYWYYSDGQGLRLNAPDTDNGFDYATILIAKINDDTKMCLSDDQWDEWKSHAGDAALFIIDGLLYGAPEFDDAHGDVKFESINRNVPVPQFRRDDFRIDIKGRLWVKDGGTYELITWTTRFEPFRLDA